ncbi:hypothetical protein GcM1_164015 [Golovinomyces cichoracearum]|uniref:Uncharacterized protein n=1 Tax=Golovinomyces cichoracearum TaxID=62708 RepID=A0A420J8C6_9PEZI|nr:hypothetical protein GcM1_164015 [Golovinomyces cichoracearum]
MNLLEIDSTHNSSDEDSGNSVEISSQALTDGGVEVDAINEIFRRKSKISTIKLDKTISLLNAYNSLESILKYSAELYLEI